MELGQTETDEVDPALAGVGRYDTLAAAEEHELVVLAMQRPCWILRSGGYLLAVEAADEAAVRAELGHYERECLEADAESLAGRTLPSFPGGIGYLALWALVLAGGFELQVRHPGDYARFIADSHAIVVGHETYRAATALLMHADSFHLLSNIAYGALFGGLVAASIGARVGWTLIWASGIVGNLLNAYHHENFGFGPHRSLGASTAVFGAIGILAGFGLIAAFLSPKSAPWARAILPIAGGIAMLGLYGLGGSQADGNPVDITAHIYGFAAGMPLGFAAGAWRILAAHRRQLEASERGEQLP